MSYVEKINVGDSLLFLTAARETLCNIIETSSMSKADMERTRSFLINEASDYQILSLLVEGDLPEEKFDSYNELVLFEALKDIMLCEYETVSEFMSDDEMYQFLTEVDSVFPNFSSAKPIMEMQSVNKVSLVSEIDTQPATDVIVGAGRKAASIYNKLANSAIVKAIKADIGKGAKGGNVDALIAKAAKNAASKVTGPVKDVYKAAADNLKQSWAASLKKTDPVLARFREKSWGAKVTDVPKDYLSKLKKSAARPDWQKTLLQKLNSIKRSAKSASDAARKAVTQAASSAKEAGTEFVKKHPESKWIAGAALAAIITYAGYKTYQRYMSKAAQACKGQKGKEKTICMKEYRKKALMAQAADTQSGGSACAKTKDPAKCKAAVQRKVAKLKAKASKL